MFVFRLARLQRALVSLLVLLDSCQPVSTEYITSLSAADFTVSSGTFDLNKITNIDLNDGFSSDHVESDSNQWIQINLGSSKFVGAIFVFTDESVYFGGNLVVHAHDRSPIDLT